MNFSRKVLVFAIAFLLAIVIGVVTEYRRQVPTLVLSRYVSEVPQSDSHVRFLAIGDYGSGDEHQRQVAQLLESLCQQQKPDAVLLLGDNFYTHGVSSVTDAQWQQKFEEMYSSRCLKSIKAYAILGNHDYEGNPTAQIEFTNHQKHWQMPARYYKVSFGPLVDIFAMDSNFPDRCGIKGFCGVDWIANEIELSKARWKFALGHHPLLSVGRHRHPKALLANNFSRVFCEPPLDGYLSGHDHNMQHLEGVPDSGTCPVRQFIVGSGGAELYPVDESGALFAKSTWGALTLDIVPNSASVSFFAALADATAALKPLYTYEIKKP